MMGIHLSILCKQDKPTFSISSKLIKKAIEYSAGDIVEEARECMAPSYSKMGDKGKHEELDDMMVDIVTIAHVQLSRDHKAYK